MPARVFLDDRVILEGEAERVHPRAGQILTVRAVPAGGGRSKDVELLTIVVAAIAAAATYGTSAYLEASTTFFASATQAGGSSYLAGAVLAGIQGAIAEGAKFALAQAVNVLIPAPSTPTPRAVSTPQSYTVSGTANGAAPFSPIPKIYGARRIFPQYAASPYTEVSGEDQYLRMLFLLGYGPLDISQINIADTAIEDYKDIEWELRAGFTDDAPSRLYPGSVAEQDFSIVLSTTEVDKAPSLSGWMTQTSGPLADELSVDVTFPGGLNAFNSKGAPIPIQCTWQIQWAPAGTQSWTSEPDIVIKSGGVGAVRRGHVWRVPRGQYDVQMQLIHFALYEGDWSTNYTADGQWTALRTIRAQAPYTMAGLATLALRIRASRQLNGVISNLNCVASSILPDYNPATGLWNDRAGGWSYDYDNLGAGASLYGLDSANAHTTTAVTDKRFITDSVIGTADGSTTAFATTLPVPAPPNPIVPGDLTYSIQPGSLIVSVGTKASATSAPGTKKKNIVGPTVASGAVDYTTGVLSITFTVAPPSGLSVTANFTLLAQTAGGRALAIQTASSWDQAGVDAETTLLGLFATADQTISDVRRSSIRDSAGYRGLRRASNCLLVDRLRQQPSFTGGELIGSRLFAFGRQRRLADAFDRQPPRRIARRAVRVAFSGKRQSVFGLRREPSQSRDIIMLGAARDGQQAENHHQNSRANHNA